MTSPPAPVPDLTWEYQAPLIDRVLSRYDVATAHAQVFRVPAEECFQAVRELDLLGHPVVRFLIAVRALPTGRSGPGTLRLPDLARPPLNWLVLGERPGSELVLGQVTRPWTGRAAAPADPVTAADFPDFDTPGFAKIAVSLRAVPYGASASILTVETRVALTDADSARRFGRYWLAIGPFSGLIRRTGMQMLAHQLSPPGAHVEGEITIDRPVDAVFDTVADERNEPRYNPRLRAVRQITPGPIGAGTRFRAEAVSMGRPVQMDIEFTDYQRPHRLASTTRIANMAITGTLTFEPAGPGTRLRWAWTVHPHGALRLLRPVVAGLGRRREHTIWTGLKRYLESPPEPTRVSAQ